MKNLCKCIIVSGAIAGMVIGASSAYMTAMIIKNRSGLCDVMMCKAKEAFKSMGQKFTL